MKKGATTIIIIVVVIIAAIIATLYTLFYNIFCFFKLKCDDNDPAVSEEDIKQLAQEMREVRDKAVQSTGGIGYRWIDYGQPLTPPATSGGSSNWSGTVPDGSAGGNLKDIDFTKKPFNVTNEQLERGLQRKPNSVLKGKSNYYIKVGEHYGVNPGVMVAISLLESGWGTAPRVVRDNNVGGIRCLSNKTKQSIRQFKPDFDQRCVNNYGVYPQLEDSIAHKGWVLKNNCADRGANTVMKCWEIYAPRSDGNPTWGNGVMSTLNYMGIGMDSKTSSLNVSERVTALLTKQKRVDAGGYIKVTPGTQVSAMHPTVVKKMDEMIKKAKDIGITIKILDSGKLRTFAEQDALYAKGRTKPGPKVTNASAGLSYHNWGLAFDVTVMKNGQPSWASGLDTNGNGQEDYKELSKVGQSLGLEWGGSFGDMPHYQLTYGLEERELLGGTLPKGSIIGGKQQGDAADVPGGTVDDSGGAPAGTIFQKTSEDQLDEAEIQLRILTQMDLYALTGTNVDLTDADALAKYEGSNLGAAWSAASKFNPFMGTRSSITRKQNAILKARFQMYRCFLVGKGCIKLDAKIPGNYFTGSDENQAEKYKDPMDVLYAFKKYSLLEKGVTTDRDDDTYESWVEYWWNYMTGSNTYNTGGGEADTGSTDSDSGQVVDIPGGSLALPIEKGKFKLSSQYGCRFISGRNDRKCSAPKNDFHDGLDLAAPIGTPMYAEADGTVVNAGPASGFGNWVVLKLEVEGKTIYTVHGHMKASSIKVKVGQTVKKGQQIAAVGNEGASFGAHLHMEVCSSMSPRTCTDPKPYLGLK